MTWLGGIRQIPAEFATYLRYYDFEVAPNGTTSRKARCKKLADYGRQYKSKTSVRPLADDFLRPFNDGTYVAVSSMSV